MIKTTRRAFLGGAAAMVALPARAENAPGVTDTEILFGQTMPYSGPASSYGTIGKAAEAYFHFINDQGGINGRKLRMLTLDDGYLEWRSWLDKYYPGADTTDVNNVYGYTTAQTLVQALKQCGNDLSRENILRQATNLDTALPMLQPGIRVKTGPEDYYPLKQMRLVKFDGQGWIPFGEAISG